MSSFLRKIWKPGFVQEWTRLLREQGVKEFIRRKGLKILLVIVLFYLIRDGLLYVVIPLLVARGIVC